MTLMFEFTGARCQVVPIWLFFELKRFIKWPMDYISHLPQFCWNSCMDLGGVKVRIYARILESTTLISVFSVRSVANCTFYKFIIVEFEYF